MNTRPFLGDDGLSLAGLTRRFATAIATWIWEASR